jgi:hypothetical protein
MSTPQEDRRSVLKALYGLDAEKPGGWHRAKRVIELLRPIDDKQIKSALKYLCEKKLIAADRDWDKLKPLMLFFRITAHGKDIVEDPSEFNRHVPPPPQINIYVDKLIAEAQARLTDESVPSEAKSWLTDFINHAANPVLQGTLANILAKVMMS